MHKNKRTVLNHTEGTYMYNSIINVGVNHFQGRADYYGLLRTITDRYELLRTQGYDGIYHVT